MSKSKSSDNSLKIILVITLTAIVAVAAYLILARHRIAIFNARGPIAEKERNLMIFALVLSLVVIIPVYFLTFFFAWKYREGNKAEYKPDWDHSRLAETTWWLIPSLLILILSVITWRSSHDLDPFKPLASTTPSTTIEVVALDWKWLFIYPDQQIATVNYVQLPVNTPIRFKITADAPMNSFWIPQLGGQIYAMSGMSTEVNLQANELGSFRGSSANISGKGFAGMHFTAESTSRTDFNAWASSVRNSGNSLDSRVYAAIARPSENVPPQFYELTQPDLYNNVIAKYMPYSHSHSGGISEL
jgi:cytochrome o ubiquinol oxidase subunit 2